MNKKRNIIVGIFLIILMIIAIAIVIINPNKIEKTIEESQMPQQLNETTSSPIQVVEEKNIDEINEQEEKEKSMQKGGTFCKIGNQIAFYEDTNKSIYIHKIEENQTTKIATLENGANKIYFDGQNIFYIPYYYSGKGIYKIDLQGNMTQIYDGASLQLWVTDNEIYFVKQIGFDDMNQNPQGTICVMDKDGNNVTEIAQNIKNYFYIENEKIYYTTQDRKMYQIEKDGSNPINLVQGRKFINSIDQKYLIYRDYGSQEAIHIFNFENNEDKLIGYFGQIYEFQDKVYVNSRKRLDDGSIDENYTLYEIKKDGTAIEIGNIANFGTEIKYILNGSAYIYNQQEGASIVNLENKEKENTNNFDGCRFFIAGCGYKLNDSELENIKIEKVEL